MQHVRAGCGQGQRSCSRSCSLFVIRCIRCIRYLIIRGSLFVISLFDIRYLLFATRYYSLRVIFAFVIRHSLFVFGANTVSEHSAAHERARAQDVGRASAELQPIFEMLSSFFGFQKENVLSPLRALPTSTRCYQGYSGCSGCSGYYGYAASPVRIQMWAFLRMNRVQCSERPRRSASDPIVPDARPARARCGCPLHYCAFMLQCARA